MTDYFRKDQNVPQWEAPKFSRPGVFQHDKGTIHVLPINAERVPMRGTLIDRAGIYLEIHETIHEIFFSAAELWALKSEIDLRLAEVELFQASLKNHYAEVDEYERFRKAAKAKDD